MASHQDDEQRHARPFYDEASSSVSLPPFLPPFDAAHDTIIRSQRLRASQLGLIDQSATLPRDEEQDRFPNAQADFEATTIASPSVDRTENVHDAGSRAYSGTSSTTVRRAGWEADSKGEISSSVRSPRRNGRAIILRCGRTHPRLLSSFRFGVLPSYGWNGAQMRQE